MTFALPPKRVDARSEVFPPLHPAGQLSVLDLFSGIGNFSLGLERTGGFKTTAFVELNPFCRRVLAKHWPDVPQHDDIETRQFQEGEADVITAGFPCQDISLAGAGAGITGIRSGLYRHVVRAVRLVRPLYTILENVAALLGRGMGTVLGDLAEIGQDAEWHCIPASAIGAPQPRDRIWIVAYPGGDGRPGLVAGIDLGASRPWGPRGEADLQSVADAPFERGDRWPQPLICRDDDRTAGRVDRIGACGNAVIPHVPELIGNAILAEHLSGEAR